MQDLTPYYQMVERCFVALGIQPETARLEQPGEWTVTKGDSKIHIFVKHIEQNKDDYFWAVSPICELPTEDVRKKFYEELLETNHTLYGAAFTKYDKWIYVKTIRELRGMDVDEMFNLITRVGSYADMYNDILWAKYAAVRV